MARILSFFGALALTLAGCGESEPATPDDLWPGMVMVKLTRGEQPPQKLFYSRATLIAAGNADKCVLASDDAAGDLGVRFADASVSGLINQFGINVMQDGSEPLNVLVQDPVDGAYVVLTDVGSGYLAAPFTLAVDGSRTVTIEHVVFRDIDPESTELRESGMGRTNVGNRPIGGDFAQAME